MTSEYIKKEIEELIKNVPCCKVSGLKGYLWSANKDGRLSDDDYRQSLSKINNKCNIDIKR